MEQCQANKHETTKEKQTPIHETSKTEPWRKNPKWSGRKLCPQADIDDSLLQIESLFTRAELSKAPWCTACTTQDSPSIWRSTGAHLTTRWESWTTPTAERPEELIPEAEKNHLSKPLTRVFRGKTNHRLDQRRWVLGRPKKKNQSTPQSPKNRPTAVKNLLQTSPKSHK